MSCVLRIILKSSLWPYVWFFFFVVVSYRVSVGDTKSIFVHKVKTGALFSSWISPFPFISFRIYKVSYVLEGPILFYTIYWSDFPLSFLWLFWKFIWSSLVTLKKKRTPFSFFIRGSMKLNHVKLLTKQFVVNENGFNFYHPNLTLICLVGIS